MTVEERLKDMIEDRYKTVKNFAEKIGVPATTVYTALNKGVANARGTTLMPIVAELGIDPKWLVQNQIVAVRSDESDFVDVPVYGSIAAGTPIEMIEADELHPIPTPMKDRYPESFLLRVKGNSMDRILPDGALALVDPCEEATADYQPYAVCVNGFDATVKRVHRLNNGFELLPDSTDPTYKPTVYDYGEPGTEAVTIIGRVVWYTLPFDWGF